MRNAILTIALAGLALPAVAARKDNQEKTLDCRDSNHRDSKREFCEMKEQSIAPAGRLQIDGKPNGGVSVKGWSRNEILVRSQIRAWGDTDSDARNLASQVQVTANAGMIRAAGPKQERRQHWSVSFEIFVPFKTSITASTTNGGVKLSDLEGDIEVDTTNGGLSLVRLAGNVKAHTTNGGVKVELDGNTWSGQGLDVTTTNGGVKMAIPANYSAQVDAGTTNGGVNVEFPVTVSGKIDQKQMRFSLGSGGPLLRARTTNGGVHISKL